MNENEKNLSGYGFSFKDYIKILENPDKIGLNNGIWSAPILKGYDKNQRGYGIDINTNKKAKALTNNRPGRWLTEKEADTLMDDHINYITEAANKHIKGFSELPFRRRWALLGMLYRGDSVNKSGININEPDDLKFFKSISDYYRSKGLNARANSSDEFFNRPVSKLLSMFKLKQGGQVRKMQTASGGSLQLTPAELKYLEWSKMTPELKREYRVNRAKSYLLSGPNITNFWEAFQTYIGNRDPENSHLQVGDVPNPGMRNPKLIIQGVLKAESIALRAAKISNKVFDKQYYRAINSGNLKRIQAVRDLHFKANAGKYIKNSNGSPRILYRGLRNIKELPTKLNKSNMFGHRPSIFVTSDKKYSYNYTREPLLNGSLGSINLNNVYSLYGKTDNPQVLPKGLEFIDDVNYELKTNPEIYGLHKNVDVVVGHDYPLTKFFGNQMTDSEGTEYLFLNPNNLKSSTGITYDNTGIIIPISQRDNFLINDIRYKQGGKMNILEFLKNGSGIHIKEKNKGKFTSYCGGKVTNECIRKAKASGNPTLVKRATFADNARHFKHKEGGKAFVTRVNVLDSNPKAYKYVKKRLKKHLFGGDIMFPNNYSNPNAFGGVFMDVILGRLRDYELQQYKKKLKEQQLVIDAQLELLKTDTISNLLGTVVNKGIDYFANKALNKNGVPSSKNTNTSFYSNPYLKTLNKVGTINSNGSMNTGIGGTTYNWNTNTFGSNNMMNSFGNIKF